MLHIQRWFIEIQLFISQYVIFLVRFISSYLIQMINEELLLNPYSEQSKVWGLYLNRLLFNYFTVRLFYSSGKSSEADYFYPFFSEIPPRLRN